MKYFVNISIIFVVVATLFIFSCSDAIDDLGSIIQPDKDAITTIKDTLNVDSETILVDSLYAVTDRALLGKYDDPLFGTIKADYLMEFYAPLDTMKFEENLTHKFLSVDSVQLDISYVYYSGDTLAPMGVSAYQLNRPLTSRNYYTNADPSEYTDMDDLWGQKTYNIQSSRKYMSGGTLVRTISIDFDTIVGRRIFEEWKANPGTFANQEKLQEFLPGFYITTTYGSGSIVEVELTALSVYYKYLDKWGHVTEEHPEGIDTIRTTSFSLISNKEVVQLNNIQNSYPDPNPLLTDDDAVYLKTPAGVFTKVTFPLVDIVRTMQQTGSDKIAVNSAKFIVKGYTERETEFEYDFGRAPNLLLIEKDSVDSFFRDPSKRAVDNKTTFRTEWSSSNNSYSFTSLSGLLSHYTDLIIAGEVTDNPEFLLIPVRLNSTYNNASDAYIVTAIYNYLTPSTAILRKDLEFSYILSHYK